MNLTGVASRAAGEYQNRRLKNLYQNDFIAWQADRLGLRTYKMMEHIAQEALFGAINRTAIKSSNGTSKTYTMAAMAAWTVDVFDPGEAYATVVAPSGEQLKGGVFKYMKSFRARAAERGHELPGWIDEQLTWKIDSSQGNLDLVKGRSPAKGKEVNTLQGVRSEFGKTFVFADEAGGLSRGLYTAAEAVLTGKDARGIFIGNPDDVGTEWQQIFENPKYQGEYNHFTISSFDLPTFTGEIVYPDDPKQQEHMMNSLTQVSWVEHKKRIWGENDARYLSKVKGEFPKDGGKGFFGQDAINKSYAAEYEEESGADVVLGVDIARYGQDESVIARNDGGRIRVVETWGKTDTFTSAKRIHKYANEVGAREVRIDASGIGGGVLDSLLGAEEFADARYDVIGWDNGSASPDIAKWSNKRSYAHDSLRTQMAEGLIDLDYDDEELREQLIIITYKFTNRGGIQITPKDDLKTEIGGSPDRLDAVILAGMDMSPWINNPLNELRPGDVVHANPYDVIGYEYQYGITPGTPL